MNTINKLNLQDESTVNELWSLQHKAYRLEAELIGFREIPPLMETREMLSRSKEGFYGCFDKDEELMGAVAVEEESPGKLTITRMMVGPDFFVEVSLAIFWNMYLSILQGWSNSLCRQAKRIHLPFRCTVNMVFCLPVWRKSLQELN